MALAFTAGFNLANIGAVASRIGDAYGIGLGVVGLFTTGALRHARVAAGADGTALRPARRRASSAVRGCSSWRSASTAALGLRETWFAIGMRLLAGVGTAAAFVGGGDYVRATIGSPVALGVFGAVSMGSGGLALAVVPLLPGWRAPFAAAAVVAAVGLVLVAIAPREPRLPARVRGSTVVDRRLLPLAVMHAASFGLSVVLGNWVVTLLERSRRRVRARRRSDRRARALRRRRLAAARRAAHRPPRRSGRELRRRRACNRRARTRASPLPLMVVAAAVVGLAAGIPFAPALAGAQRLRPDAPGRRDRRRSTWSPPR